MAAPTYSEQQKKYWAQRPANKPKFMTVEFYHPDFDFIRLVANQFSDKTFDVEGTPELFKAAAMTLPEVTNQSTDTTQAGTISFARIGTDVRDRLFQITPLGAISNPIVVRLRQYESGLNVYERKLYVNKDGISISADSVNIRLSVDNPARLSNEQAFYDPAVWLGLSLG